VSLRGPDAAFDEFVESASPSLLRLAYRFTGDKHLAEDLLQGALWRVAKHWSRARENPGAYAQRTLVNLAADGRRHRRRRPAEVPLEVLGDRSDSPSADRLEDRDLLLTALRRLPPRQRAVLVLRYWEDMSIDETAALLSCSIGNVKSTASRGLDSLRNVLTAEGAIR
jgi:RNA polymerase sigma-70 factor (sigma-E family)